MLPRRPRLERALYLGLQRYFLTFCTADRQPHFKDAACARCVLDQILHTGSLFDIAIVAYCFMPDHLHLLVEGCREDSDLIAFAHRAKQVSGYEFAQRTRARLWQPSFHDRILRNHDATLSVVRYIFENPIRAGLAESPRDYALLGSNRFTIDEILEAVHWQP